MRTRSLFLVVLLSLAPALQADVGFRLPNGSRSRANTAKGYLIRLDALPWGADGNTVQPNFIQLAALRYGGTFAADTKAPDVSGLHVTDYEAALTMIASLDPEWCRNVGGSPCHPGRPTQQESHDAQYWSFGSRVIERARELGFGHTPDPEGKTPVELSGPDAGKPGEELPFGVSGCDPLRWRWMAAPGIVRGRGNAVTVTFKQDGVYTVTVIGTGGNCGQATRTVTIGNIATPPPPPPPPDDEPEKPETPEEPGTPPAKSCADVVKELEPLLRQMLQVIESGKPPA